MIPRFFVFALLSVLPCVAASHEFWLEPEEFQVETGAQSRVHLRNGEGFVGSSIAFFPSRSPRFALLVGGIQVPLGGRMGDIPAFAGPLGRDGLVVMVHEAAPSTISYNSWEKFAAFATHKDFKDMRARHDARGLPETGFAESYTRHSKTLIGVGSGAGKDAVAGLETEFVALTNPYTDDPAEGMRVRLLYRGAPRADAQVEVYARDSAGNVSVSLHRTDAAGEAQVPVMPGHTYLLDAVVLRPAAGDTAAVWHTLWASLTFSVPAP